MSTRLLLALVAATLGVGALVWLGLTRADTEIRVARGGTATVISRYGRSSPLGDTIIVRGAGARRRLRVVNEDTVQHVLAVFTVAGGATQDYTVSPGSFNGYCSAHAAGKHLTVLVQ